MKRPKRSPPGLRARARPPPTRRPMSAGPPAGQGPPSAASPRERRPTRPMLVRCGDRSAGRDGVGQLGHVRDLRSRAVGGDGRVPRRLLLQPVRRAARLLPTRPPTEAVRRDGGSSRPDGVDRLPDRRGHTVRRDARRHGPGVPRRRHPDADHRRGVVRAVQEVRPPPVAQEERIAPAGLHHDHGERDQVRVCRTGDR